MSESLIRVDRAGLETLIQGAMCSRRVWTHSELAPRSVSVNESDMVKSLLQALQGLSSPYVFWDRSEKTFRAKTEIQVSHLSQSSLHGLLSGFLYAATCLKLVESIVCGINTSLRSPPTLMAFSNSVSAWLEGKGSATKICKHHWLLEQKLLNFVDAFHQYVMDRVYHTAWRELCESMVKAVSLGEVIYVHEAYLLSIQRQCFVVQEKLWSIIASRINMILGLALEFYSIQQTLSSGGVVSAMKARCEMEIDRIEKQFEDCIAFLLRVLSSKLNVGHFPHLADLVTRINYNYHYMSDTGSLMTVSGAETKSSRA